MKSRLNMLVGILLALLLLAGCGGGGGGNPLVGTVKTELSPGTKAPELLAATWLNGETQSLEKLKGKYVLLEFCLSTCQACKDAVPTMASIYDTYKASNLAVLSVSYEDASVLRNCAASYPQVVWPIGAGCNAYQTYGVLSYPHCFVIDPQGLVAWEGKPTNDLTAFLAKTLAGK